MTISLVHESNTNDLEDYPHYERDVVFTIPEDASWPECLYVFLQFLRATGYYIDLSVDDTVLEAAQDAQAEYVRSVMEKKGKPKTYADIYNKGVEMGDFYD